MFYKAGSEKTSEKYQHAITMKMVLLAGVWEAEVREEKEEEADEEDETKQAAHNQLCFRFHLSVLILT